MNPKIKRQKRIIRHRRVRSKVSGTKDRPRISVFRSHKHVFLQLIDDASGKTLVSASSREAKSSQGKSEKAKAAAKLFADRALAAGVKRAVFDRGGNRFQGRIKTTADIIKEAGIQV